MIKKQLNQFIASEHLTLVEAMQKIDKNSNGILFILDDAGKLIGAVSDGDIRRWILGAGSLDASVSCFMNHQPKYIHMGEVSNPYSYMIELCIRALPVVDGNCCILDILLLNEKQQEASKEKGGLEDIAVIVMAGGKGTRLYPFTKILPKPLIPIGEVPILERIINSFCEYSVKNFYLTVNYKKNMIRSYFSELEKSYHIEYVEEDKPLGTAGSIRLIQKNFNRPLFVTNCDILVRANYSDIYKYHINSGNAVTIVSAMKNDVIPYGVVYSKENGEVESMEEKPCRSYFVNTGMYIINPEMIPLIPKDTFFHMTHLTNEAILQGFRVGMYPVSEDSFLDMGEFEEMRRMEEKLKIQ